MHRFISNINDQDWDIYCRPVWGIAVVICVGIFSRSCCTDTHYKQIKRALFRFVKRATDRCIWQQRPGQGCSNRNNGKHATRDALIPHCHWQLLKPSSAGPAYIRYPNLVISRQSADLKAIKCPWHSLWPLMIWNRFGLSKLHYREWPTKSHIKHVSMALTYALASHWFLAVGNEVLHVHMEYVVIS